MAFSTGVGMLSINTFNLADTYFISKLGVQELAAISFTPAIILSLSSLTIGLGIGLSVVISKVSASDLQTERRKVCSYSILLSLIFSCLFGLLGVATTRPLFSLLGASGDVLDYVEDYMSIWYLCMPLLVLPIVGNSAIRGIGNARFPAMLMMFSSLSNLILDPLLIFGFGPIEGMGIEGAAWASMIARLLATLIAVYYLYAKAGLLRFGFGELEQMMSVWRRVMAIALPVGASRVLTPLSMGVIVMIVSRHGESAVAAFGVGSRIESFSMICITAVSIVLAPFIGQNLSHGAQGRVEEAIRYGLRFCVIWGALNALFFSLSAGYVGGLFSDSPQVIDYSVLYLYIVPVSLIGLACQVIVATCCNPLGKPFVALKLGLIRMWGLCIPAVLLGGRLGGFLGIVLGLAIGNILSGLLSYNTLLKVQAEAVSSKSSQTVGSL